MLIASALSNM